jgi:phosphate transport system substrate-binding protein
MHLVYCTMAKSGLLIAVGFLLSCSGNQQALKIKGSDTEVNLVVKLAEEFHAINKEAYVSISGGGSGLGIASLLNGQTDIANSSRELNETEKDLFIKKGIAIDTFVFAEDAIAFIVSPDLPLDSISIDDLGKILNGTYQNWNKLCNRNMKINIYGRQSNSGTFDFVKSKLNIQFSENAKEMNGNAQIIEAIKSDRSGIGYVGAGYVLGSRIGNKTPVKVLKVGMTKNGPCYSPIEINHVFRHVYYFRRHLYQYILSSSSNNAAAFIDFEKSPEGAAIIQASGYYPIIKH